MKSELGSFFFDHLSVILGFCLGFWLVARILRQHLRPSVSLAWLMSIVLIPYVGVPAYFLFGGRKMARRMRRKTRLYPKSQSQASDIDEMDPLEHIMLVAKMPPVRRGGRLEFIPDGKQAYATLIDLISGAKKSVHVMTFILGRDEVGESIVDQLAVTAAKGVTVRLLLDGVGSFGSRGRFVQPLRDAGGHVAVFAPVLPLRRKGSANLRNHRKMILIDGRIAIVGGMNLAMEYMGPDSNRKRWLDSALLLEGPTVQDLEEIFADDWNFAAEESKRIKRLYAHFLDAGEVSVPSVQVTASGPDIEDEPIHDAIMTACINAKKRIWMVVPYFVPDESIEHAILLQARLGRDVRILLPRRSDHFLTDLARGPFLRRMKKCGVKIFLHSGGMIHAKHMIVDDNLALAGSMNLDMRSLYLNYEVGVFIRSQEDVRVISDWAQSLMDRSEKFTRIKVNGVRSFLEDLSLLISPLL